MEDITDADGRFRFISWRQKGIYLIEDMDD